MRQRALKFASSYELGVSATERLIAVLGRNVTVADVAARTIRKRWHPLSHPSSCAFSQDERTLAVKSTWGEFVLHDLSAGLDLARVRPKTQDEGSPIAFSPCGQYLIDGSWGGFIRVRRTEDLIVVREFWFEREMIKDLSTSMDGGLLLFLHQPIVPAGAQRGPQPYLTLWKWPMEDPAVVIPSGLDNVYAASLSPGGREIAIQGFSLEVGCVEVRLVTVGGEQIAACPLDLGGTGPSTRWSRDESLIGVVAKGEFRILSAPTLNLLTTITDPYPSDLAFISNNREVVLAGWEGGRVVHLHH